MFSRDKNKSMKNRHMSPVSRENNSDYNPQQENGVLDAILFFSEFSKITKELMDNINAINPSIKISLCNLSCKETRRKVMKSKEIKIVDVPSLLVVMQDGSAEIYGGGTKIIDWFVENFPHREEEEEDYEEEIIDPEPTKDRVNLEFAFPGKGKPTALNKPTDAGKEKYKSTMELAKKMKQDMEQTHRVFGRSEREPNGGAK